MAKEQAIKMTFKDMKRFNAMWNNYKKYNPDVEQTKLGYAFKKFFVKSIEPVFEEYNLLLSVIRVENALEDEKTKAVLTKNDTMIGGRGFEYSKDGLKAVMKAEVALDDEWDPKEFTVEPFITKDVPKKLTEEEQETFKGFII